MLTVQNFGIQLSRLRSKIKRNYLDLLQSISYIVLFEFFTTIFFILALANLLYKPLMEFVFPFIYHKFQGNNARALQIKMRALDEIHINLPYMKKNIKGILFGAIIGIFSFYFNTRITASILKHRRYFQRPIPFGKVNPFKRAFDRYVTLYAPIIEEYMFRGIILNYFKILNLTLDFISQQIRTAINAPSDPNPVTFTSRAHRAIKYCYDKIAAVISFFGGTTTQPAANPTIAIAEPIKPNKVLDSAINVLGSAILFSRAHSPAQQPYAFVGGVTLGTLYEYYDDGTGVITPCIAAHMANNVMATMRFG